MEAGALGASAAQHTMKLFPALTWKPGQRPVLSCRAPACPLPILACSDVMKEWTHPIVDKGLPGVF